MGPGQLHQLGEPGLGQSLSSHLCARVSMWDHAKKVNLVLSDPFLVILGPIISFWIRAELLSHWPVPVLKLQISCQPS